MSRSDQYIGLTHDAVNYLASIGANLVRQYTIEGAWNDITLAVYERHFPDDNVNLLERYTEVVQESPWSSGPMYFTNLKWELIKKKQPNEPIEMGYIYSWSVAPDLKYTGAEFDYNRGVYYV